MIKWFKSAWLHMRKSNGLPGPTILVPLDKQIIQEPEVVKKPRKPRVKKEKINDKNA